MGFKQLFSKRRRKQNVTQDQQQDQNTQEAQVETVPQHQQVDQGFRDVVDKINSNVNDLLRSPNQLKGNDEDLALFHRDEILIGKHVGSGAFSDVYEVSAFKPQPDAENDLTFHQSLARECLTSSCLNGEAQYVIKHLRPKFLEMPRQAFCMAAADLVVEGNFLASLNHPHILGIRGWGKGGAEAYGDGNNDGYFLIVKRLDETLEQRMERWNEEGISDDDLHFECARIGTQISSALEYLHGRNLIFRDLKPDNIGFDVNDKIKIFDFGLCRELPSSGESNSLFSMTGRVGTLRYMSPECALKATYGISSDVYSFSMVLFEMMNRGYKAFAGARREEYLENTCRNGERPEIDASWPIMIQDLLERGWSTTIKERPSMSEINNRLQDVMMDLVLGNPAASEIHDSRQHIR